MELGVCEPYLLVSHCDNATAWPTTPKKVMSARKVGIVLKIAIFRCNVIQQFDPTSYYWHVSVAVDYIVGHLVFIPHHALPTFSYNVESYSILRQLTAC